MNYKIIESSIKERKNNYEMMFYRHRKNDICTLEDKFSYTDNANSVKHIIDEIINENENFSITSSNSISDEVFGKSGIILKTKSNILELDERIYRVFKNEIERKLNNFEKQIISFSKISNKTKIIVNMFNSSIEFEKSVCNSNESAVFDIKRIKFNRTNSYDMELLNSILDDFLNYSTQYATIEHIGNGEFYLICEDKMLLFDMYAYHIVLEKTLYHNRNIEKKSKGISFLKK